ncbi:helix-turn-helix transcriptional regulator [Pedobacter sp. MR2016-19]|uniref:helix-turn-helix domain-containing protein n=1 Tax=unclassified Pedobacter TaxID=2628915 RepID=UPI0018737B69|nr:MULTISPECIES: AraC family transcriptional regulator [unclassified Pedobacter]MBE5317883.1 helix-turn-helix transcriptional regulator [Pedobacter sp. MR2016-19]QXU41307.1 AraC family transcriptional regulator [Pedobacter sp. D749]
MNLHIKNMVCNRCKMVVKAELEKLGFKPLLVELGEVTLAENITAEDKIKIAEQLTHFDFELLEDKKNQVAEQIKTAIINLVHYTKESLKINLSAYLSEQLNQEYTSLSSIFSEIENQTIEKYFIAQKIEKAKEMLTYGELTLSEIAYQLNYSSVAHLSAQFKKVTEITPSVYKSASKDSRKTLDKV